MQEPEYYASYNGLSRIPDVYGIPFMPFIMIIAFSTITATGSVLYIGGYLWIAPVVIGVSLLFFIKSICVDDLAAFNLFVLELKWKLLSLTTTNHYNKTITLHPIKHDRDSLKDVRKYFKKFS